MQKIAKREVLLDFHCPSVITSLCCGGRIFFHTSHNMSPVKSKQWIESALCSIYSH